MHILISIGLAMGILWVLTATRWGRRVTLVGACLLLLFTVGLLGGPDAAGMCFGMMFWAAFLVWVFCPRLCGRVAR
jgi:hypothetical protein